jgi:hypothetical protein
MPPPWLQPRLEIPTYIISPGEEIITTGTFCPKPASGAKIFQQISGVIVMQALRRRAFAGLAVRQLSIPNSLLV